MHQSRFKPHVALTGIVPFLLFSGSALAASYDTGADVGGTGTCSYTGCYGYGYDSLNPSFNVNATSSSSTSPSSSSANGSGTGSLSNGSSWGASGIGNLHAYATATAFLPPDPSTAATGEAHARAYWDDTLSITSSTLTPGTPVDLTGNLHLDGNLIDLGFDDVERQCEQRFQLQLAQ